MDKIEIIIFPVLGPIGYYGYSTDECYNKLSQINKQLAQALVYKNQPRSKYKLEAQNMLEKLIEGDMFFAFNFHFNIFNNTLFFFIFTSFCCIR